MSKVNSIQDLLPEDQDQRIERIGAIRRTLEGLKSTHVPVPGAPEVRKLKDMLDKCKFTLRKQNEEDPGSSAAAIDGARRALLQFIATMDRLDRKQVSKSLRGFQNRLFHDLEDKFNLLRRNLSPSPIRMDELPRCIRERFVSKAGQYLLQIYPSRHIWQRDAMVEFVKQLRTVEPDATGAPVLGSESAHLMTRGYLEGGGYALMAIVMMVLTMFRNIKDTFLVLLPVVLSTLWTIGLMHLFGLDFNLANLVVIPLIIGIAVDGGIHLIHRVREEGTARNLFLRSTPRAITICFLSTMVGFGSLMIADHALSGVPPGAQVVVKGAYELFYRDFNQTYKVAD